MNDIHAGERLVCGQDVGRLFHASAHRFRRALVEVLARHRAGGLPDREKHDLVAQCLQATGEVVHDALSAAVGGRRDRHPRRRDQANTHLLPPPVNRRLPVGLSRRCARDIPAGTGSRCTRGGRPARSGPARRASTARTQCRESSSARRRPRRQGLPHRTPGSCPGPPARRSDPSPHCKRPRLQHSSPACGGARVHGLTPDGQRSPNYCVPARATLARRRAGPSAGPCATVQRRGAATSPGR